MILEWMLGDELRKARLKASMSQEKLAFRARVDRSYISEIERNIKSPTVAMLLKLCQAMDTQASSIIAVIEKKR